ncbi:MAG: class II fructose-bisphosphate aldolase [Lachnospiraceae bacterium]|jgi:ketose-bisphosphate aldolase|nr:class II fructose-bisphosphate aldolase [Lachnospiraceae bacterium]
MKLTEVLRHTISERYAVGSFSPRYQKMIRPILEAAQENRSPAIVQISSKELTRYGIVPKEFAREYFMQKEALGITVPVTLHLDHTYDFQVIRQAVEAGFESVMIDASAKPFEENVAITRRVVEYAHERGVNVEAELGKIGANDQIETDVDDQELYTVPEEAVEFVERTGVDALAVSVGTAHGVYTVRQPCVQYALIREIKKQIPAYLVLHGGSGVPAEMVIRSYEIEGGGISKVNIATDLELAFLEAIGAAQRGTDAWCSGLEEAVLEKGRKGVRDMVTDKMIHYLHSNQKAF